MVTAESLASFKAAANGWPGLLWKQTIRPQYIEKSAITRRKSVPFCVFISYMYIGNGELEISDDSVNQ